MSLRHLPNLLCVLRILMVYPVAHWILQERYADVMLLFAVAASTDGLDGFLAKRFRLDQQARQVSRSARRQAAAARRYSSA